MAGGDTVPERVEHVAARKSPRDGGGGLTRGDLEQLLACRDATALAPLIQRMARVQTGCQHARLVLSADQEATEDDFAASISHPLADGRARLDLSFDAGAQPDPANTGWLELVDLA